MKSRKSGIYRTAVCLLVMFFVVPSCFMLGASENEGTSVSDHMKAINRGFKELRRSINAPNNTQTNLALIAEIKAQVKGARKGQPSKISGLAESEREPFLQAYQALLGEVIQTLDKLETAVKAEKLEEASALVKKLNEQKKKGHNKFQD